MPAPSAKPAAPQAAPYHEEPGVAEAAPPPYDPRRDPRFRNDHGVAEAAPPPYEWRNDVGVAEAAPPPFRPKPDAGQKKPPPPPPPPPDVVEPPFREDHGVAEAAPPPYDDYRRQLESPVAPQPTASWHDVRVSSQPKTTISLAGVGEVKGKIPERPLPRLLKFSVVDPSGGAPWQVTLSFAQFPKGDGYTVAITAQSSVPLEVSLDGMRVGTTPLTTPQRPPGRAELRFEDPKTKQRLSVDLELRQ